MTGLWQQITDWAAPVNPRDVCADDQLLDAITAGDIDTALDLADPEFVAALHELHILWTAP